MPPVAYYRDICGSLIKSKGICNDNKDYCKWEYDWSTRGPNKLDITSRIYEFGRFNTTKNVWNDINNVFVHCYKFKFIVFTIQEILVFFPFAFWTN